MYWVRKDNFDEYEKIKQTTIDYYLEKSFETGTEYDIAMVLKQMYKDLLDEKFEPDLIEYDLPLSVCRILFVCSSIRTLLIMILSQLYQLVDKSMCRQHSTLSTGAGTARSSTAHSRLVYRTVQ